MAILYTLTSLILTIQTIYYDHIYRQLKCNRQQLENHVVSAKAAANKQRKDNYGFDENGVDNVHGQKKKTKHVQSDVAPSSPIPLPTCPCDVSPIEELYYMSARSLSTGQTPTAGSFPAHHTRSVTQLDPFRVPLLGEVGSPQSAPPPRTKTMLCTVSFVTILLGTLNFQKAERSGLVKVFHNPAGYMKQTRRRLLQATEGSMKTRSLTNRRNIGMLLGWGMAVVYMGGRLPQIFLNIRRENVEGLNPLMFLFALLGNSTYVASILVSSLDWSKIRPNLPWLVDAGGCMLLDTFIVIQFIYFRYWGRRNAEIKHIT